VRASPRGTIPYINAELAGREEIRAAIERMQALMDYVSTPGPGTAGEGTQGPGTA
jgi:hypothetical protein